VLLLLGTIKNVTNIAVAPDKINIKKHIKVFSMAADSKQISSLKNNKNTLNN